LALLALCLMAMSVEGIKNVQTSRKRGDIVKMAHTVQRYKYDNGVFKKVPRGFCAYPTTSDNTCDWDIYMQEVMIFGSVGIILSCLLIIFWVAFWLARRFCRCCGGMDASSSRMVCLVDKDQSKFNGYASFEIWLPKIVIWLMFLTGFILLAIGWANNEYSRVKLNSFADKIQEQGHSLQISMKSENATIMNTYNTLFDSNLITRELPNTRRQLAVAVVSAGTNLEDSGEAHDIARHFEAVRFAITHFTFFLCMFSMILGCIAAMINKPKLSLAGSQIAMFGLVLNLIVFGFHYAFTIVSCDVCDEMDKIYPVQNIAPRNSSLGALLGCDETVRMQTYDDARASTEELRQLALFSGCSRFLDNKDMFQGATSTIQSACRVWADGDERPFNLDQGKNVANSSCTVGQYGNWQVCDSATLTLQTVYSRIVSLPVAALCQAPSGTTVAQCADSCVNSTCSQVSRNLRVLFGSVSNSLDGSIQVVTGISQCDFLLDWTQNTYDDACDHILTSSDAIWGVCLGLIFVIGLSSTMMLLGFKRFDEENARAGFIPKYHFKRSSRIRPLFN